MRKIALMMIMVVTISIGIPFGINGQWWGVIACSLTGILWLLPTRFYSNLRTAMCLLGFSFLGVLGFLFGHSPWLLLTNFVLLLIAWDLDHYSYIFYNYEQDQDNRKMARLHFYAHLKRLGLLAALGWLLGALAMNIRIQINFSIALLFILLVFLFLRQVARTLINTQP
jgi:hypothetical protein